MADTDDFEMINELGMTNDQIFDLVLVQEDFESISSKNESNQMVGEISLPIVDTETNKSISSSSISISPPERELSLSVSSPITSTFNPIPKQMEQVTTVEMPSESPKKFVFIPVPSLPPPPAPQRYGDAATIPHNLFDEWNVGEVIKKSREQLNDALQISVRDQQRKDIETVLEQRRLVLNKQFS